MHKSLPLVRERAMEKCDPFSLPASEQDLVIEIFASNYMRALTVAKREADDDEFCPPYNELDCVDEAASIDPDLLPKSKREKFANVFGPTCGKFKIDTAHLVAESTTEYPRGGGPGSKGVAVTDTKKRKRKFVECAKFVADDEGDNGCDEYVTITIATGRGGRGMYRVPKSVAGDMMGHD
mgnify:CR=1 FL=1